MKKITEAEDKNKIENYDVAYSYLATLSLVIIILVSAKIYWYKERSKNGIRNSNDRR